MPQVISQVKTVFFDYGGVLADEGFFQGLGKVAREHGVDPEAFFARAVEIIYADGYVYGRSSEQAWWAALTEEFNLTTAWQDMRQELLDGFRLRPWMLELVDRLRERGAQVAILSDQTNWLDELDARDNLFLRFDGVFNSYHHGLSKREYDFFHLALKEMAARPEESLFIDDSTAHVGRARELGLRAHCYEAREPFLAWLEEQIPGITRGVS